MCVPRLFSLRLFVCICVTGLKGARESECVRVCVCVCNHVCLGQAISLTKNDVSMGVKMGNTERGELFICTTV